MENLIINDLRTKEDLAKATVIGDLILSECWVTVIMWDKSFTDIAFRLYAYEEDNGETVVEVMVNVFDDRPHIVHTFEVDPDAPVGSLIVQIVEAVRSRVLPGR